MPRLSASSTTAFIDEGLQVLPDALAAQLGDLLKLNTTVTKLAQTGDGWMLTLRENGREPQGKIEHPSCQIEHSAVIYCGTAYRLAELEIRRAGTAPVSNYFK